MRLKADKLESRVSLANSWQFGCRSMQNKFQEMSETILFLPIFSKINKNNLKRSDFCFLVSSFTFINIYLPIILLPLKSFGIKKLIDVRRNIVMENTKIKETEQWNSWSEKFREVRLRETSGTWAECCLLKFMHLTKNKKVWFKTASNNKTKLYKGYILMPLHQGSLATFWRSSGYLCHRINYFIFQSFMYSYPVWSWRWFNI